MRFLLVHSPVVGPATWLWVRDALEAMGHHADVPDLRDAARSGNPEAFVQAARRGVRGDTDVLAGHSGAGVVLPMIGEPAQPSLRTVFVDAGVPPCQGASTPGGHFLARLRALAVNGIVPRWSHWWPDGTMETLVPNEERRGQVEEELPEVPLAFFETSIEMPESWCDRPAAFLLVSDSYRDDATTSTSRGWPILEHVGNHLDLVNDPVGIARALVVLAN